MEGKVTRKEEPKIYAMKYCGDWRTPVRVTEREEQEAFLVGGRLGRQANGDDEEADAACLLLGLCGLRVKRSEVQMDPSSGQQEKQCMCNLKTKNRFIYFQKQK